MIDHMPQTTATPTDDEHARQAIELARQAGVLPIPGLRGWYDPRSGEVLISLVPRKAHVLSPSRRGWQVSLQDDDGNRRTRSVGQIVVLALGLTPPEGYQHIVPICSAEDGGTPVPSNFAWALAPADPDGARKYIPLIAPASTTEETAA